MPADPIRAVLNQPPPLEDYDLFESDTPLREAVEREGGGWISAEAHALGKICGSAETLELGRLANEHPPVLHTHEIVRSDAGRSGARTRSAPAVETSGGPG